MERVETGASRLISKRNKTCRLLLRYKMCIIEVLRQVLF